MNDQIENKIVSVKFDNEGFSKKIESTIKDLQKFEKEIDNISKNTITIAYNYIESRHNIQKALYDISSLSNKEIIINIKLSNDIEEILNKINELNNIHIKDIEINSKLNISDLNIEEINKKLEEIVKNIKTPDIGLDLSLSSMINDIKSGIAYKFGDEIGNIILTHGKKAFSNIDLSILKNNLTNIFSGIKNLIPSNITTAISSSIPNNISSTLNGSIKSSINMNAFKDFFKNFGTNIVSSISNAFGKAKEVIKKLDIMKGISSLNTLYIFIDRIKKIFSDIFNKLKDNPIFGELIKKFETVKNAVVEKFKSIDFKGLKENFKKAFNNISSLVGPLVNKIKNTFNNIDLKGLTNKFSGAFLGITKFLSANPLLSGGLAIGGGLFALKDKIPIIGKGFNILKEKVLGVFGLFQKKEDPLNHISDSVDNISNKFTILGRVWFDTLTGMVQNAVNAGIRMVKSLSIDNITSGYSAMEAKNNSIRTIMNSTVNLENETDESKLERITNEVEKLVTFTDETSYNFQDMMNGLSSFTSAGVDLEKSVSYMMGIANWAAYAGKNAKEASTAFDVMSKVIANGSMDLMRFRQLSTQGFISNATRKQWLEMASKVGTLKKEIDSAGNAMYKLADGTQVTAQNMETTLTKGKWLNSDVITKSLGEYSKFSDTVLNYYNNLSNLKDEIGSEKIEEMSQERLEELSKKYKLGISDIKKYGKETMNVSKLIDILGESVDENGVRIFDKFAVEAFKSAQEARTFGDAIESVKVAVSAGWSKSFEIIFGNAQEAAKLWTGVANTLWDVFAAGAEVRNNFLSMLKDLGVFSNIFAGIGNIFNSIISVIDTLKEAFMEVFFPELAADYDKEIQNVGKSIQDLSVKFKDFTATIITPERLELIKTIVTTIFSVLKIGLDLTMGLMKTIRTIFIDISGKISSFFSNNKNNIVTTNKGLEGTKNIFEKISEVIKNVPPLEQLKKNIVPIILLVAILPRLFKLVSKGLFGILNPLNNIRKTANASKLDKTAGAFQKFATAILMVAGAIFILSQIPWNRALIGLGIIAVIVAGLVLVFEHLKKSISKLEFKTIAKISILLVAFGVAMMALSVSLIALSGAIAILGMIPLTNLIKGVLALVVVLGVMALVFWKLTDSLKNLDPTKLLPVAAAIIAFSLAMVGLSLAVAVFALIPFDRLVQGVGALIIILASMAVIFTWLVKVLADLDPTKLLPVAAAIIAFSLAMVGLSLAVAVFALIPFDRLVQGVGALIIILASMAVIFTWLVKVLADLDPTKLLPVAAAIIAFSLAMVGLSLAVAVFALLPLPKLIQGVVALVVILGAMALTFGLLTLALKKLDPSKLMPIALALIAFSAAMLVLAGVVAIFSLLPDVEKGLISLATVLILLTAVVLIISKVATPDMSAKFIALAVALLGISVAFFMLEGINYNNVAIGLGVAMVALLALTGIAYLAEGAFVGFLGLTAVLVGLGAAALGVGAGIDMASNGIDRLSKVDYQSIVDGFGLIAENADKFLEAASALAAVGIAGIISGIGDACQGVGLAVKGFGKAIDGIGEGIGKFVSGLGEGLGNLFKGGSEEEKLERKANAISLLADSMEKLKNIGEVSFSVEGIQESIDNLLGQFKLSLLEKLKAFGLESGLSYITGFNESLNNSDLASKLEESGKESSKNYVKGLSIGISDNSLNNELQNKVSGIGNLITKTFDKKMGIASPAKVGKDEGGYYVEGIKEGIAYKTYLAEDKANELAQAINNGVENGLSDEEIQTQIVDQYLKNINKSLEDGKKEFKDFGKDEGGYFVNAIIDGVESKKYLTDEAAKELGLNFIEGMTSSVKKEDAEKIGKNWTTWITEGASGMDIGSLVNNLKNLPTAGGESTTDNDNQEDEKEKEKERKAALKAHKSFLKSYKEEREKEKEMVKYFANEEKKIYEQNLKDKKEGYTQELLEQTNFKNNAQQDLNTWLDTLASSYELADESFNDYLENMDENTSQEDKIYARRLEALKKFNADAEVANSGMNWGSASVSKRFEQKTSEVKSNEAIKNLQSYLGAYEGFKSDMKKIAGTNISDKFLSALYKDGPNGELFLAAKNMKDDQLELLGKTWDEIHGYDSKGDSIFLTQLLQDRKNLQASHKRNDSILGSKDNPITDEKNKTIYVTEDAINVNMLEHAKKQEDVDKAIERIAKKKAKGDQDEYERIKEALHDEYDKDDEISEDDQIPNLTEKIDKKIEDKKELEEKITEYNNIKSNGIYSSDNLIEDDTYSEDKAYKTGENYVTAIAEGAAAALPALQNTMNQVDSLTGGTVGENIEVSDKASYIASQVTAMQGEIETTNQAIAAVMESIKAAFQGYLGNDDIMGDIENKGEMIDRGFAKGIKKGIPVVVQAVGDMCKRAIEAAKAEFGIASPSKVFYDFGEYIIDGLVNAIDDGESRVTNAMVGQVLKKMHEKAKDEEDINSPSGKWYSFGEFIDQGLANGISDNVQSPINALGELLSGISEDMEMDEEYNPVITPVLDLSEAKKQSKSISSLIGNQNALSISAEMSYSKMHQNEGQNNNLTSQGKTINFTQNNYSPKELSRLEIYRQTNNQFSQFKTLLEK